jgi:hypothetical protein
MAGPFHLRYCTVEVDAFPSHSSYKSSFLVHILLNRLQLKIIVVLVAPPPLAASRIAPTISDPLLCFVCFISFTIIVYISRGLGRINQSLVSSISFLYNKIRHETGHPKLLHSDFKSFMEDRLKK